MPPSKAELESVFKKLKKVLSEYAPPFKATQGETAGKLDYHIKTPKPVVLEGSYGNKPQHLPLASLIVQKGFVAFHFLPVYLNPKLIKKLPPDLLKLLKGKACFNVKEFTPELGKSVTAALQIAQKEYKTRRWL